MTALETEFAAMRGAGRPKGYTLDGEKIPAVTTVNSCLHPRGLFWWHWENGKAGREFGDGGTPALEVGSLVHRMVENKIHGVPLPHVPDELLASVASAYGAWERWLAGARLTVVATEIPLVSKVHKFGGTIDCILRDEQGRLCLGDYKTSKALYADYLRQVAAYGLLYNENAPENAKLTGGFHLIRFAKENGDFEHRHFPDLDDALEAFLLLRRMYDLNKTLEARVK